MTMEERTKGEDRKDQFGKMNDVNNILNMNQQELLRHEYLKYRIKRLEEVYPWLSEQKQRLSNAHAANAN